MSVKIKDPAAWKRLGESADSPTDRFVRRLFLGAPRLEDPAADLQSRFLTGILKIQVPFLIAGFGWAIYAGLHRGTAILAAWLLVAVAVVAIQRTRWRRSAAWIWSITGWSATACATVLVGGMSHAFFYSFLICHIVGILLTGYHRTLGWILAAGAATAGVFVAERRGWIGVATEYDSGVSALVGLANVATAGFALLFLVAGLQEKLRAAESRRYRLQQRNQELEAVRSSLEIAVAERTERLAERNRDLEREVIEHQETEAMLEVALDASEAAARAKSEFLANMSHEIRTPLNGVLGLAESLGRPDLEFADRAVYLRAMKSSGASLLRIIDDVLDLSKLEAGAQRLDSSTVDLKDTIEDIFQSFASEAARKGLELTYDASAAPPKLITDPARLRQILVNLVGNAMKFTDSGGISIRVESAEKLTIRFTVTDTGMGIAPQDWETLFEPFQQADSSIRRVHGGTGLGLAICRLTQLLGGRIWGESEVDRGSTFYFTIRADQATGESDVSLPLMEGARVLVVEPREATRAMVCRLLTDWSCEVTSCRGLDELRSHPPDQLSTFQAIILSYRLATQLQRAAALIDPSCQGIMILGPDCEVQGLLATFGAFGRGHVIEPLQRKQLHTAIGSCLPGRTRVGSEEPQESSEELPADSYPMRILVAEDNSVNRLVVSEMLSVLGYTPKIVADGFEAVEACREGDVDLVLMDIMMPKMDGLEATREIRRTCPADKQPVILALSASVVEEQRQACLDAGADGFLSKPMQQEVTRRMIARVARGRSGDTEPMSFESSSE